MYIATVQISLQVIVARKLSDAFNGLKLDYDRVEDMTLHIAERGSTTKHFCLDENFWSNMYAVSVLRLSSLLPC